MIMKERTYNAIQEILEVEGRKDLLAYLKTTVDEMDKDGVDATNPCICLLHDALVTKSR